MMHKAKFRIILLFFMFSSLYSKASVDFDYVCDYKNIKILYNQIPGSYESLKTTYLAYLMHSLTKEFKKQNINVILYHNANYWYYLDTAIKNTNLDTLAIGYEKEHKHTYPNKGIKPTICIYYYGEFNIEKHMNFLHYALTHIDEIEKKQKYITTLYRYTDTLHLAVSQSELRIDDSISSNVKHILSQATFSLWFDEKLPEIDYYYADGNYHIIKRDVPKTTVIPSNQTIPPAKGKEILALNDLVDIYRFNNKDYIVFDSENSFYYFNSDSSKAYGPFTTLGLTNLNDGHYILNDLLILKMKYPSPIFDDIYITITFDRKTKMVTTNELKIMLYRLSCLWVCISPSYKNEQFYW